MKLKLFRKILLYPNGNNIHSKNNFISIYLENLPSKKYLHVCTEIIMIIRNYNDYSYFHSKSIYILS